MEEATFGEPGSCRHKNNLFVFDQVCLVAATNALLSIALLARMVTVRCGRPAGLGCMWAGRAQAGTKQLLIVCAQTYEYVQVCALSIRTKNQL
jgi:hypothetical protein